MDRTRLDRLAIKLFLAIAGTIAALTFAAYFVFSTSFERGFMDYLRGADEARLEVLIDRLEEVHEREGSWASLVEDRERWIQMVREALGLPRGGPSSPETAPRRDTPLTIDPRLMLFDAERGQLVGRPEGVAAAVLKPIEMQGSIVGYLGYVPRPELLASIERVYLQRQHVAFSAIALGMLATALFLGAGLAYWLTRRVRVLAAGTHALIEGNYAVRLDVRGHDELSQLARDFNALAATLAAAKEARQQWIADIAHELRTPLAVLRAEVESLQDGVRPLDQTAVSSLASETSRLARLVEDLHTLSLSDLGALTYYREPLAIAEVIEDVLDAQRRTLTQQRLEVRTELDESARVHGDEARLGQVFANLLQNSVRYTDAPGTIAVKAERRGERVIVTWEDSAPGVPAEELQRLTERLYRVEGSRNRASGGAGLGLAIAKAIVAGHGGTLGARASALGGIAIEIALPAYSGRNGHG
jgi:two-component system, OmpR family, sensor histidine kinase BaeS